MRVPLVSAGDISKRIRSFSAEEYPDASRRFVENWEAGVDGLDIAGSFRVLVEQVNGKGITSSLSTPVTTIPLQLIVPSETTNVPLLRSL